MVQISNLKEVTVLLACKDREKNLAYCLGSIDGCNPRPQVVLVDFGSTKSLVPYQKKYGWLQVIRVERRTKFFHKTRAYNIGLKQITSKFICSTDTDEVFEPNFFDVVFTALKSAKNPFVMCKTYFWKKRIPEGITPDTIGKKYYELRKLLPKNSKRSGEGCCMGTKTAWAKYVHGWDERYIGRGPEDSDFMVRADFSKQKRIWIHNKTSMIHLAHEKNAMYINSNREKNNDLFRKRKRVRDIVVNVNIKWGQL
jgi:glycosyltransferase involved in cell wall biosynthesis